MKHKNYTVLALAVLAAVLTTTLTSAQSTYTPYTFTTLAGRAGYSGSANGTGSAGWFNSAAGVAVDSAGNLYVTDQNNQTIRKVTPAGEVTTLAGSAHTSGSADGTNGAARFYDPFGLTVDSAGNLYITDLVNHTIRKVTPVGTNWVVTTLAGKAGSSGSADGTNGAARFYYPNGLTVDSAGSNVFVADTFNNTLRNVTPVGTNWVVTTLAGRAGHSGSADGTNSAALFNGLAGVAVDSAGNVYVADDNNNTIRKVTPVGTNWVVTTLAGKAGVAGSADGTNSVARFNFITGSGLGGLKVDSAGNLYVADYGNNTIRKVMPAGTNWVVTTLAGLAGSGGVGFANGTGSAARFNIPNDVAVDSAGNLYVADYGNYVVRRGLPANSVPAPDLEPPSLIAGQFAFGITGLPNLAVNIESSADLSNWKVLAPYITLAGGTNYYVSPTPPQGVLFYRAQVR